VGGNPARIIKYRFAPEKVAEIIASKWWEKSIDELKQDIDSFIRPPE
jgi:virginiamycin A acetyltransferase